MNRTRVVSAALTLALPLTTVQIVEAPVVQAHTVQTRTVTELDRAAFDAAIAKWQKERDAAQAVVEEAAAGRVDKQNALEQSEWEYAEAKQGVADAEAALAEAQAALAEVDVEAREHDVQQAAAALERAETKVATAENRVEDAERQLEEATDERDLAEYSWNESLERSGYLKDRIEGLKADIAEEQALQNGLEERDRTGADYSVDDWERLTSQAIAEYINDYRVANGLHPLVTHEVYNRQAKAWSARMVADIPELGDGAYRHSTSEEFGWSAENIAIARVPHLSQAKRSDWREKPEDLFEQWRNSPGHNMNMLSTSVQGIGLGIEARPNGELWATTMFFRGTVPRTDRWITLGDAATEEADESGIDYYVPSSAREELRTPELKDTLYDSKGYSPDYGVFIPAKMDRTDGKVHKLDPQIHTFDHTPAIEDSKGREKVHLGQLRYAEDDLRATEEELQRRSQQRDDAVENQRVAQERLTNLSSDLRAASNARSAARNAKGLADDALEYARSVDKQPLLEAVANAEAAVEEANNRQAAAADAAEAARAELQQAGEQVKQAQNQLERVPARPAESTFMVSREITETVPEPTPQDDGSSAGTIIGIVVAILAVVGIAVAALPQLGIQLPF